MKRTTVATAVALGSLLLLTEGAWAAGHWIASDSAFGCRSRDYFSKLIGYAVQKDLAAFKEGLGGGILAGQCTLFKFREEVFIADTAIFSGLVKVRKKGSTAEYWTNIEAVK